MAIERVTPRLVSMDDVWLGAYIVLAGYLLPTSLFPPGLAAVARVLPFHAVLGFPVELAIGRLSTAEIFAGLGLQLCWLAVLGSLATLAWRRGLRAYGAFGA